MTKECRSGSGFASLSLKTTQRKGVTELTDEESLTKSGLSDSLGILRQVAVGVTVRSRPEGNEIMSFEFRRDSDE